MTGSEQRSSDRERDGEQHAGMPRWVKAFGGVVLLLLLVMLVIHLTGGRPSHSGSPAVAPAVVVIHPAGLVS